MACSSARVLSVVDFGFEFGVSCFLFFFGGEIFVSMDGIVQILFFLCAFFTMFVCLFLLCLCFTFFLLIVPNPTPSRKSPSKPAACSLIPLFFRIYL